MGQGEPAYLSIIQWPDEADEHARVEALVAAAGMDPTQAEYAVRRGVPAVVARIDALVRDVVLEELRGRGVMALAPSRSELRDGEPPDRIKRLERMGGGSWYACEMWRSEPRSFKCEDLWLIVSGAASEKTFERRNPREQTSMLAGREYHAHGFGPTDPMGPTETTSVDITHLADLHCADGSCLRIDTDKFNFEVLGGERGYSDLENIRKLVRMIAGDAPRAIVDANFQHFRTPPDLTTEVVRAIPGSIQRSRDTSGLFDFYSRWAARFYMHLTGGGPAGDASGEVRPDKGAGEGAKGRV